MNTDNIKFLLEDYKFAKTELQGCISSQYNILSILATASVAAFVYIFSRKGLVLLLTECLLIPGIYCFFGILWLDEVYRQERIASYVFNYESIFLGNVFILNDEAETEGKQWQHIEGWQHYVKDGKTINGPSRCYYYVCLGLFFTIPLVVYICGVCYFLSLGEKDKEMYAMIYILCRAGGLLMYIFFIIFSMFYIKNIMGLNSQQEPSNHREKKCCCKNGKRFK